MADVLLVHRQGHNNTMTSATPASSCKIERGTGSSGDNVTKNRNSTSSSKPKKRQTTHKSSSASKDSDVPPKPRVKRHSSKDGLSGIGAATSTHTASQRTTSTSASGKQRRSSTSRPTKKESSSTLASANNHSSNSNNNSKQEICASSISRRKPVRHKSVDNSVLSGSAPSAPKRPGSKKKSSSKPSSSSEEKPPKQKQPDKQPSQSNKASRPALNKEHSTAALSVAASVRSADYNERKATKLKKQKRKDQEAKMRLAQSMSVIPDFKTPERQIIPDLFVKPRRRVLKHEVENSESDGDSDEEEEEQMMPIPSLATPSPENALHKQVKIMKRHNSTTKAENATTNTTQQSTTNKNSKKEIKTKSEKKRRASDGRLLENNKIHPHKSHSSLDSDYRSQSKSQRDATNPYFPTQQPRRPPTSGSTSLSASSSSVSKRKSRSSLAGNHASSSSFASKSVASSKSLPNARSTTTARESSSLLLKSSKTKQPLNTTTCKSNRSNNKTKKPGKIEDENDDDDNSFSRSSSSSSSESDSSSHSRTSSNSRSSNSSESDSGSDVNEDNQQRKMKNKTNAKVPVRQSSSFGGMEESESSETCEENQSTSNNDTEQSGDASTNDGSEDNGDDDDDKRKSLCGLSSAAAAPPKQPRRRTGNSSVAGGSVAMPDLMDSSFSSMHSTESSVSAYLSTKKPGLIVAAEVTEAPMRAFLGNLTSTIEQKQSAVNGSGRSSAVFQNSLSQLQANGPAISQKKHQSLVQNAKAPKRTKSGESFRNSPLVTANALSPLNENAPLADKEAQASMPRLQETLSRDNPQSEQTDLMDASLPSLMSFATNAQSVSAMEDSKESLEDSKKSMQDESLPSLMSFAKNSSGNNKEIAGTPVRTRRGFDDYSMPSLASMPEGSGTDFEQAEEQQIEHQSYNSGDDDAKEYEFEEEDDDPSEYEETITELDDDEVDEIYDNELGVDEEDEEEAGELESDIEEYDEHSNEEDEDYTEEEEDYEEEDDYEDYAEEEEEDEEEFEEDFEGEEEFAEGDGGDMNYNDDAPVGDPVRSKGMQMSSHKRVSNVTIRAEQERQSAPQQNLKKSNRRSALQQQQQRVQQSGITDHGNAAVQFVVKPKKKTEIDHSIRSAKEEQVKQWKDQFQQEQIMQQQQLMWQQQQLIQQQQMMQQAMWMNNQAMNNPQAMMGMNPGNIMMNTGLPVPTEIGVMGQMINSSAHGPNQGEAVEHSFAGNISAARVPNRSKSEHQAQKTNKKSKKSALRHSQSAEYDFSFMDNPEMPDVSEVNADDLLVPMNPSQADDDDVTKPKTQQKKKKDKEKKSLTSRFKKSVKKMMRPSSESKQQKNIINTGLNDKQFFPDLDDDSDEETTMRGLLSS